MRRKMQWKDSYRRGVWAKKEAVVKLINEEDSTLELISRSGYDSGETVIEFRLTVKENYDALK